MENGGNFNNNVNQQNEKKRNNPNFLSSLFLWWVCPVIIKGNKRDVEENDLIIPAKKYDSEIQGEYFEKYVILNFITTQIVK